jgi:hypothetical protein
VFLQAYVAPTLSDNNPADALEDPHDSLETE